MKTKIKFFAIIISLFGLPSTVIAQNTTVKFENVVNEQFGTLLESLLKDGKIDEANAKTYIETVFGYDEGVSNYLQTVNLSKQIQNIAKGTVSLDTYVSNLNETLLSIIPENYRKKMLENPYYQGTLIGNELKSGYISEQSIQLISNVFKNIADEKKRTELILSKFEELTPKLNSLKNEEGTFTSKNKKSLNYTVFSESDWAQNKSIPEKQSSNAYNSLENLVTIADDKLTLSNSIPKMHDHALFMFYTMRTFKNKERFDFSKDFQLDVYFEIPDKTRVTGLGILIGKSFQLELLARGENKVNISTPSSYKVTKQYGFLRSGDWPYNKIDQKITRATMLMDGKYKLTIVKKGFTFTCLANGEDIKVSGDVVFFPDKYFLGFKQAGTDPVKIVRVDMKHL